MSEHIETPCPEGAPCAKVLDNLCDILEVRLGHTEGTAACQKMIDHVRNCPTCWAEVETLCRTVELCKKLPGREVPGEVENRLFSMLNLDPPADRERVQQDR